VRDIGFRGAVFENEIEGSVGAHGTGDMKLPFQGL